MGESCHRTNSAMRPARCVYGNRIGQAGFAAAVGRRDHKLIDNPRIQKHDFNRVRRTIGGEAHRRLQVAQTTSSSVAPNPAALNQAGWAAIPERLRAVKGAGLLVG